jgi:hypothetical protein
MTDPEHRAIAQRVLNDAGIPVIDCVELRSLDNGWVATLVQREAGTGKLLRTDDGTGIARRTVRLDA